MLECLHRLLFLLTNNFKKNQVPLCPFPLFEDIQLISELEFRTRYRMEQTPACIISGFGFDPVTGPVELARREIYHIRLRFIQSGFTSEAVMYDKDIGCYALYSQVNDYLYNNPKLRLNPLDTNDKGIVSGLFNDGYAREAGIADAENKTLAAQALDKMYNYYTDFIDYGSSQNRPEIIHVQFPH